MAEQERSLYSIIVDIHSPGDHHFIERLPQDQQDLHFGMLSNGYYFQNNAWKFNPHISSRVSSTLHPLKVSLFGPNSTNKFFGNNSEVFPDRFSRVFSQEPVTEVIGKYRQVDRDLAIRLAFIIGGQIRHPTNSSTDQYVRFIAEMINLGNDKSAEAIAVAMALFVRSGGSIKPNKHFTSQVQQMSEAIEEDPIIPYETKDLGASQVRRLRAFLALRDGRQPYSFPDIIDYEAALGKFPTVGAEFHFTPESIKDMPNIWERLAILNMSQYQSGSHIQLSRNDREVIEIRMNPSIYPITIANWSHLRLLLPELNRAFFTLTLNRLGDNFDWKNEDDKFLLLFLRTLGLISYASVYKDVPVSQKREEIKFGAIYLGQTVRVFDGKFRFDGNWSGDEGEFGQVGLYVGFGAKDVFPELTYYPSMVLAKPEMIESIVRQSQMPKIYTLEDAVRLRRYQRHSLFRVIKGQVEQDGDLSKASMAGARIIQSLIP